MGKEWKTINFESCPNCGDALEVLTECLAKNDTEFEQYFYDGDEVRCFDGCGFISAMSADGESAWVQDGNIDELLNVD